nr:MAG TPA: hypothetical protein [Caudoviricetes sp.]
MSKYVIAFGLYMAETPPFSTIMLILHAFLTLRYPFACIIYSPVSLQYCNIST